MLAIKYFGLRAVFAFYLYYLIEFSQQSCEIGSGGIICMQGVMISETVILSLFVSP